MYNSSLKEHTFTIDNSGVEEYNEFQKNNEKEKDILEVVEEPDVKYDKIRYVIDCSTCHSLIYKNKSDLVYNSESELFNIDDECPVCHNASGYSVVGKIDFSNLPDDEKESD